MRAAVPRPERPRPMARYAVNRMIVLLGVRRVDPVTGVIVNSGAIPIGIMMGIEAVRHPKCRYGHQKHGRQVPHAASEITKHRRSNGRTRNPWVSSRRVNSRRVNRPI